MGVTVTGFVEHFGQFVVCFMTKISVMLINVVSFTSKIFAFWRQFASVLFLRAVQEGASFIEACSRSDNAFIVLVAHCEQRGVISQSLLV